MTFTVTILGSSSAKPAYDRHPSAQVLQCGNDLYLIDCGEGTQMQMQRFNINPFKITHIFISHLHGDHYLGLLPLLDSLMLNNRTKPLYLFAPEDCMRAIVLHRQISAHNYQPDYELIFQPTQAQAPEVIVDNKYLTVTTLPLQHGLPCTGFLFKQKQAHRKMIGTAIEKYQIPYHLIPDIKKGADYTTPQGMVIPNNLLTTLPPAPLSYAYCSDTAYSEPLIPLVKGVDVLYHESTYLSDMQEVAPLRGHSTSIDAAKIARAASVGKLFLGHFSPRYDRLHHYLHEARPFFPDTYLATEGLVIDVAGN